MLTGRGTFQVVLPRRKGHKYDVDYRDGRLYIRTNQGAKDFRVVSAPVEDSSPARWKPFVDAEPGVLVDAVELFKGHAVVSYQSRRRSPASAPPRLRHRRRR